MLDETNKDKEKKVSENPLEKWSKKKNKHVKNTK